MARNSAPGALVEELQEHGAEVGPDRTMSREPQLLRPALG